MLRFVDMFKSDTGRKITCLIVSGLALLLSLFHVSPAGVNFAWVSILLCGVPIILGAAEGLIKEFDIKADVLVSLALIASVAIGEYFAAGEVAFIMQIGALLEELTVEKARAGIEKLVQMTPQTARVLLDGEGAAEQMISAKKVLKGMRLRVLPGEMIPVDGVILKGQTSVNQAVLTGESLPVDKEEGDEVFSGTVNQYGSFEMEAVCAGEDSSIQRMIRLVQSADAEKAKIVGLADRWATWIVVIALLSAAGTWIVTGELLRSVTILVVFCPCALVLATPTAIMAAIGNAARHGFLVKEGDALERLANVQVLTFDKTGTLTNGTPRVIAVESFRKQWSDCEFYKIAASVEKNSEHPLGKAVIKSYQETYEDSLYTVCDFRMEPGQGIYACLEEEKLLLGNERLMQYHQIAIPEKTKYRAAQYQKQGCTLIWTAVQENEKWILAGFIALADTLRPQSRELIGNLRKLRLTPVLLTGDTRTASDHIAAKAGIFRAVSECLPEQKLQEITSYQNQNMAVCMIGDGINDAPALKKADVGIAMGGIGSDIAVEAADIALINDEISELPHLFALSKRMMRTIKANLTFSMLLNFLAIILAMSGTLNPVVGALVHNCGSVFVILNSAALLRWQYMSDSKAEEAVVSQSEMTLSS